MNGDNNTIIIGNKCFARLAEFHIEDSNNSIVCGDEVHFSGKIHMAVIEGTKLSIGDDCLFSSDIVLRTGDSHSLLDLKGDRINFSKDIIIHNHVWVGHKVTMNKGVIISDDTVVGAGAIVTKAFTDKNVAIAGVPAKIVKRDVNWTRERI